MRVNNVYDDGTIDDIAGSGPWHLEDMGTTFYFGVETDDGEIAQFSIECRDGEVVVVPYGGTRPLIVRESEDPP